MAHWLVKFTRRGMEPPRPFGRTSLVVCAATREDAKELVAGQASDGYRVSASPSDKPVGALTPGGCSCGVKA